MNTTQYITSLETRMAREHRQHASALRMERLFTSGAMQGMRKRVDWKQYRRGLPVALLVSVMLFGWWVAI